ncbi:MAG: RNA methyltransferase [Rhodoferax sp.]|nr:RNA methyltransferase [Rhodoferax sp.]
MKTRFILINTSHAGNVGAAARAMKTMGFGDMVLVAPRWANVLRREETIQRASGALDVLNNARIVETLDEALDGMTHLCATAMTPRDFGPPTRAPREHFDLLLKEEQTRQQIRRTEPDFAYNNAGINGAAFGMGFLFGSERFGMSNEDVYRCNVALSIPTNPRAEPVEAINPSTSSGRTEGFADAAQITGMLKHWEQSLTDIGFLDPAAPKKLMPRLNQLFNRAQLSPEEIHILRGIAKAMSQAASVSAK